MLYFLKQKDKSVPRNAVEPQSVGGNWRVFPGPSSSAETLRLSSTPFPGHTPSTVSPIFTHHPSKPPWEHRLWLSPVSCDSRVTKGRTHGAQWDSMTCWKAPRQKVAMGGTHTVLCIRLLRTLSAPSPVPSHCVHVGSCSAEAPLHVHLCEWQVRFLSWRDGALAIVNRPCCVLDCLCSMFLEITPLTSRCWSFDWKTVPTTFGLC